MAAADPHDLARFLRVQAQNYGDAERELRAGRKETHWMWYVFPQLRREGLSSTSEFYSLEGWAGAAAYLAHPVLGLRLLHCAELALATAPGRSAGRVLGAVDADKLKRCATLFAAVSPPDSVFERLLRRFFRGRRDRTTLTLLRRRQCQSE